MTEEERAWLCKDEHLGDGAYVSFDGYQFWLAANHHTNKLVALEPRAIQNLVNYVRERGFKLK